MTQIFRAPATEALPPWHYRLGKWLGRRGVRGSGLLIRVPHRLGLLQHVVRFPVSGGHTIDVPLYRQANQWDAQQVREYEAHFLDAIAEEVRRLSSPVTLVDCGADIGLFSVSLVARCEGIARVVAFEPDAVAFEILERNLSRLGISSECYRWGLAEKSGRARLKRDGGSEHAAYLAPNPQGNITVTTLDEIFANRNEVRHTTLVLKIDVEGSELAVLRGAEQLLREVPRFVIGFEAHSGVTKRTGIDPIECARWLSQVRSCQFRVSELPDLQLSVDRGFFEQVDPAQICNVVAVSLSNSP
jgi:FkbM family methyltransferase